MLQFLRQTNVWGKYVAGKLPKNNEIKWRGDSGLQDGSDVTDIEGGLVGGY